jgi:hypothetical protein
MLAGGLATAAAPALAKIDPTNPADVRLLQRKLLHRADDGLVFWWLQGLKYGQVGVTLTPLFNINVGTIQRVTQRSDGGFDLVSLEMVFLTDVATGRRLTEFKNPYTNETLPVKFDPLGPTPIVYRPDNTRVPRKEIGGAPIESTAEIAPPSIVGNDVFVRATSTARVMSPGRNTPFEVNDISVYSGKLDNLSDPKVMMGDATVFFAEVTGWQRWLNMGDRPGGLTSRTIGRKVKSYAEMPADWRAMVAEVAPEIAKDPVGALSRPEAKYSR